MSDVVTNRLAEIRENYARYERFKNADDGSVASFVNTLGSAAHAAVDGIPPLLAAVDAVLAETEEKAAGARLVADLGVISAEDRDLVLHVTRKIRGVVAAALGEQVSVRG